MQSLNYHRGDNMPNPQSPAAAIRKFFNDPRFPMKLAEIKEFKIGDPSGYDEIGALCIAFFAAGGTVD